MDPQSLLENVSRLAARFASQRGARQQRRHLDPADFAALAETGFSLVGLPREQGGLWRDVRGSTRLICNCLRTLAAADSSLALVSSMHPAVLSYWLTAPAEAAAGEHWLSQTDQIAESVRGGKWWGTITSEPGSGGDVARTRSVAARTDRPLEYLLSGQKHFGSGSGMASFMVTTAIPEGESEPDWFFVQTREVPWDGSQGLQLLAEWDGHGMIATQSHGFQFERFPATRIAWPGHLLDVSRRAGPLIGCLFTSVIVGIVDAAIEAARDRLPIAHAYERVEWVRASQEHWLICQALEGMLRAIECQDDPRLDVLQGKTAVAELAESLLTRLCRALGGGTFARHSPFGHWFEDVRALGFLRPPWGLAYQQLADALLPETT